jgi:hypothetical protein
MGLAVSALNAIKHVKSVSACCEHVRNENQISMEKRREII